MLCKHSIRVLLWVCLDPGRYDTLAEAWKILPLPRAFVHLSTRRGFLGYAAFQNLIHL